MSEEEVKKAEKEVQESTERVEAVIDHLRKSIDDKGRQITSKIRLVQSAIGKSKQDLKDAISSAQPAIENVAERPELFWAVVLAVGAVASFGYTLGKRSRLGR